MPVVVPNSFNQKYNNRNNSYNYGYDNMLSNEIDNLMEENETKSHYLNRLENKIRRLENINNIFLNILRESYSGNRMTKNYSYNDLNFGSYPYLSFDNNRNKSLLYLNRSEINNTKIIDGKYKNNYLVPILPKYNSVEDKNRINYLLNNEKLKYFSRDSRNDSRPYFSYNNRYNSMNIPQKINSVQYFNKKIDYKKYNSSSKINAEINSEKNSKENILINSNSQNINYNNADIRNEINKLNNNLNERLSKIENLQKTQKKDIDYLMGKSKGSKSENVSKKDSIKNNNKNQDKKEEKKEDKKENNKDSDEDEDEESDDEEDNEEDDDDDDDDDEKEVGIKSIGSD